MGSIGNTLSLSPGQIIWVSFDPVVGREQSGNRPAIIVSTHQALELIPELLTVCPITSKYREWASRIPITLESGESWIIVEQIQTISVKRVFKTTDIIASPEVLTQFTKAHNKLVIHERFY